MIRIKTIKQQTQVRVKFNICYSRDYLMLFIIFGRTNLMTICKL
jgi:hypothetical protein